MAFFHKDLLIEIGCIPPKGYSLRTSDCPPYIGIKQAVQMLIFPVCTNFIAFSLCIQCSFQS